MKNNLKQNFLENNTFSNDDDIIFNDEYDMEVGDDDHINYDELANKTVNPDLLKNIQNTIVEISKNAEEDVKILVDPFIKKEWKNISKKSNNAIGQKKAINTNSIEGIITKIVRSELEPLINEISELKERINNIYK